MIYEKEFNEYYAITALKYLWDGYRDGFIKCESPDWINVNAGIGVEVTQALLQYEGETRKFLTKYLGAEKNSIPADELKRYGDRAVFFEGRLQAVTLDETADEAQASMIFKALYRFDKKFARLNDNYTRLKINCLYMYLHTNRATLVEAETIFHIIKEQTFDAKLKYNFLFLDDETALYILDFDTDNITVKPVTPMLKEHLMLETYSLRAPVVS